MSYFPLDNYDKLSYNEFVGIRQIQTSGGMYMETIRFMTSLILFYLKGKFVFEQNFVKIKTPNTLLGLIPLGSHKSTLPVNQLSSVESNFRVRFGRFLLGIVFSVLGILLISKSFIVTLVLLLIGVNAILSSFETHLTVKLTSGDVKKFEFFVFEKKKADMIEDNINKLISNRMDDTNTRSQTDRIVDAINSK